MVRIAQVGVGYWGKNLLRNFASIEGVEVVAVCDQRTQALEPLEKLYPSARMTSNFDEVLKDDALDAIVVATETPHHYELARASLQKGKHVFVEKPMARSATEAEDLVRLAEQYECRLMVGHLLLYHPAFVFVENLIARGELGQVYYLYSQRVNLGIIRQRENALESLAPHDLSIALQFMNGEPVAVSAQGQAYLQRGIEDVAFATVYFDNGQLAHLHTSWLDPQKIRKVTVVGSRRMAVVDDTSATEKVRLYDKGVDVRPGDHRYAEYPEVMSIRSGDIRIPDIAFEEPLRAECRHFVECVRSGQTPKSDGRNGLTVVRLLEAAQRSVRERGVCIEIEQPALSQ
jgi:predicted dehydrogenase